MAWSDAARAAAAAARQHHGSKKDVKFESRSASAAYRETGKAYGFSVKKLAKTLREERSYNKRVIAPTRPNNSRAQLNVSIKKAATMRVMGAVPRRK